MEKIRHRDEELFYDAILTLKTPADCRAFFEDICTIKELQSIAQRFRVAALLDEGRNYLEVSEETGASSATISRVNRSLSYGTGAYERVFARLKAEKAEEEAK